MRLYTSDNTELMEVSSFKTEESNLVVCGTIMGAMPIEAVLTPTELRSVFKLLTFKTVWHVIKMLFTR